VTVQGSEGIDGVVGGAGASRATAGDNFSLVDVDFA
jgi:hypothetical protein